MNGLATNTGRNKKSYLLALIIGPFFYNKEDEAITPQFQETKLIRANLIFYAFVCFKTLQFTSMVFLPIS